MAKVVWYLVRLPFSRSTNRPFGCTSAIITKLVHGYAIVRYADTPVWLAHHWPLTGAIFFRETVVRAFVVVRVVPVFYAANQVFVVVVAS